MSSEESNVVGIGGRGGGQAGGMEVPGTGTAMGAERCIKNVFSE